MDKRALKAELCARAEAALAAMDDAQRSAREGATHEEAKPESDKDTRAVEQSYLARGQAARVEELARELELLRAMPVGPCARVGVGALLEVEDEAGARQLFVAPGSAGASLAEGAVHVITPRSPIGAALMGKVEGDEVELVVAGKRRALAVLGVR